jgi:ribosomal protein L11 methyltransferase
VIRLAVRVRREHAELALAELLELAPGGVEEVEDGELVEYAVYGAPGELPELPDLRAAVGDALVEVSASSLDDDWAERWRSFHRPLELDGLRIRPPWIHEARPPEGIEVVIDPGRAFGTGSHATTRMCLELLLETPAEGALADWGCGSGVLAIAAAKLGFAPVVAVDNDPASVEAAAANGRANGVELAVERVDIRAERPPWAPTVTANLVRPLLLELAAGMDRAPERLIASGLLVEEAGEVAGAFAPRGLRERERRTRGEWAALLLDSRQCRDALNRW